MRIPKAPHSWSVTPKKAIEIQEQLAGFVRQERFPGVVRYVAGADLSIFRSKTSQNFERYIAGIVVWDKNEGVIVETQTSSGTITYPYVPGLLSFREVPAILQTLKKLKQVPDLLMCDGQGFAHPRRFGLACHLGVLLDFPTIGCAKSRLCGTHGEVDTERGSQVPLVDKKEIIGAVVRTRTGVKPVFVSVGNKTDLPTAVETVLSCTAGYRLPEPTGQAHKLVVRLMRESQID